MVGITVDPISTDEFAALIAEIDKADKSQLDFMRKLYAEGRKAKAALKKENKKKSEK